MEKIYWDDLEEGTVFWGDTVVVDPEEMLEYARRNDPQPFHLDEASDRRPPRGRPCPGGGDRRRWQRRQACARRGRGGDGEHGRRPGLARQSPRQGARSEHAPTVHRRWREGAQAKAIRNTFGVATAIQRCQIHNGRNIIERLPEHLHASVKKALRQAWDQDDADKAERLLRNLARRLEQEEPGISGSILEGLDEILTVIPLGLPHKLRRSLACTNIIENALGTVRQVTRNVKRWRHAEMALRWTAARREYGFEGLRNLLPHARPPYRLRQLRRGRFCDHPIYKSIGDDPDSGERQSVAGDCGRLPIDKAVP